MTTKPADKLSCAHEIYEWWSNSDKDLHTEMSPVRIVIPGRPERPELVHPRDVPKRGFNSESARIKLVHAIAHIEFNAINLAWDAVYRFRDMPEQFYADWIKVAREEAYHFGLLHDHLKTLGYARVTERKTVGNV